MRSWSWLFISTSVSSSVATSGSISRSPSCVTSAASSSVSSSVSSRSWSRCSTKAVLLTVVGWLSVPLPSWGCSGHLLGHVAYRAGITPLHKIPDDLPGPLLAACGGCFGPSAVRWWPTGNPFDTSLNAFTVPILQFPSCFVRGRF